jgi:hypothetical protein
MKPYPAIILVSFLTTGIRIAAQSRQHATDSVSAIFTKFKQTRYEKTTVLLTNRNIYLAGENIWFKAYVANPDGKLDLTFNNLFADLVNENDKVIAQVVLDNKAMQTSGAFRLSESIPTGFYLIRCYTAAQMLKGNPGVFFHPIFVLNKRLHDESSYAKRFEEKLQISSKLSPYIHFYPERLSANSVIISTGVIEIKDHYNNPLSVKGNLMNSKDSVISSFRTNNFGLARLTFVNDPGEKYAAIFYVNGNVVKYELPAANESSIQLSLGSQTAKTVKAFVTLEDSVPANTHTTLLAIRRDSLYYAAVGTGNYGITIPIDNFPGGITRLLLFDGNNSLVSERDFYIPQENVDIEVMPDKRKSSSRENITLHLKITGTNGVPLASVLNIAVEDQEIQQLSDTVAASTAPPFNEFLLDHWLARYQAKYSLNDIDLLLTTRKSIFQDSAMGPYRQIEEYDDNKKLQNLIGKIASDKGNGVNERIITAIAKNTQRFFMDVDTTDKDGRFSLSLPQGFDSLQLSVQVTDKHRTQTPTDSIIVECFQYPNLSTSPTIKQQLIADNLNSIDLLEKHKIDTTIFPGKGSLPLVTVKAIKEKELNYDVSRRVTSISQILTSDKFRYGGRDAIGNAILTVPGVTLISGDISIFGLDISSNSHIRRPLILMDGNEIPLNVAGSVLDFLNSLSPADIDFIEVLRGAEAAVYGHRGAYGVISINSRHGPDKSEYNRSNLRVFSPVTYHVCPKFEMPDYSNEKIRNSPYPDPRTAIYWSADIATDTKGEATVNFYTADNVPNYAITVTGLTATGELIYKRMTLGGTAKRN